MSDYLLPPGLVAFSFDGSDKVIVTKSRHWDLGALSISRNHAEWQIEPQTSDRQENRQAGVCIPIGNAHRVLPNFLFVLERKSKRRDTGVLVIDIDGSRRTAIQSQLGLSSPVVGTRLGRLR